MYIKIDGLNMKNILGSDEKPTAKLLYDEMVRNHLSITGFITSAEVERNKNYYDEMHQLIPLNEGLVEEGKNKAEIKDILLKYLVPLELDKNELTIIDRYLLPNYKAAQLLSEILLDAVPCKKVRVITNRDNENNSARIFIEEKMKENGFAFSVEYNDQIHDRWWLSSKSGIYCGTSLNGLGKKCSTIDPLSPETFHELSRKFL